MPRQTRWVGDDLYWLITLSIAELRRMYPQYNEGTLKGKKAYWKQKIKLGETEMPPKPEQEPSQNFGEILKMHNLSPELAKELSVQGFHVGFIKNSDGEIEYTIPLPHAKSGRPNLDDFTPAVPARITPSRRKPVEREYKSIYVFSDAQIDYRRLEDGSLLPLHDDRALEVGRLICRDIRPDLIVNLGDTVDMSSLSRFQPDSDHFHRTLGPSFQRAHDYYAQLRSDNPNARMVEVDSNHNTRIKKFMLRFAPSFYGVKQARSEESDYPVFTYPFLANLKAVNVEWVSGYGAAELIYGKEYDTPPIIFKHGEVVGSPNSNVSTATKEAHLNGDVNIVRGHSHRIETAYRTNRAGQYLASIVVGAACKTTGEVPSYGSAVDDRGNVVRRQENWQTGVLVIEDHEGKYVFNHITINDGKAFYNGKEYTA